MLAIGSLPIRSLPVLLQERNGEGLDAIRRWLLSSEIKQVYVIRLNGSTITKDTYFLTFLVTYAD